MRHYTKILAWENNRRLNKLIAFRELVIVYFNNSHVEWIMNPRVEEEAAQKARSNINLSLNDVHSIILKSGIMPTLRWIPPAATGGYVQNVNLIHDIFNLDGFFEIQPAHVLDFIDRTIGVYESNTKSAFIRIFNPFFYAGLVFDFISDLPFIALGKLGFNRQKARSSTMGRRVKGGFYLITVFAAFLTILHLLEFLAPVKRFVHALFGTSNAI